MTWLLRLVLRPFRAIGRAFLRLLRKVVFVMKLAALFSVAMLVLDAILNRDGDRDRAGDS